MTCTQWVFYLISWIDTKTSPQATTWNLTTEPMPQLWASTRVVAIKSRRSGNAPAPVLENDWLGHLIDLTKVVAGAGELVGLPYIKGSAAIIQALLEPIQVRPNVIYCLHSCNNEERHRKCKRIRITSGILRKAWSGLSCCYVTKYLHTQGTIWTHSPRDSLSCAETSMSKHHDSNHDAQAHSYSYL